MCSGVEIVLGEGAEGTAFTGRAGVGEEKERRDLLKIYVYFCYDKAAGMYKCKGEIIIVVMQAELCFLINRA